MRDPTNLRVLTPSRKRPRTGDVFILQLPDGAYRFGRVIRTDALVGSMKEIVLVYIYKVRSDERRLPSRSDLRPTKLLVPPIMTNRLPWSRGYFETIANLPLDEEDVLQRHSFRRFTGRYYDEYNNELSKPIEPTGEYGLYSYLTIDDTVSDASGFARAGGSSKRRTSE